MIDAARRRLLAGLPVTERRVRAGGCSTALLEAGDGPPVVMLHGGIECGARLGWPLRIIEAAGHVPHIERPDDFLEVFS